MSFMVGVFVVEVGFIAWEIEGNGLRARDEGNGWLILGVERWAGGKFVDDESARGDDTKGRETVMFGIAWFTGEGGPV